MAPLPPPPQYVPAIGSEYSDTASPCF